MGRSLNAAHDTRIVASVRPEHLSLAIPNETAVRLPVTIDLVEPTGAETHIYAKLRDTNIIAASAGRCGLQAGDATNFYLAPQALHIFDAQTGNRL